MSARETSARRASVLGIQRDADARADAHLPPGQHDRPPDQADDSLRDDVDIGHARDAGEQHDEFVTARSRHDVAVAQRLGDPVGDQAQHFVTDVVAERVVDRLETVEVDEQEREAAVVVAFAREQRGQ
jgi:hypothetical protein